MPKREVLMIMRRTSDKSNGIFLREEMGYVPQEENDNAKKKKKQKDKRNGKNKTHKNNNR